METATEISAVTEGASTSNHVYIYDEDYGWIPGKLLSTTPTTATVRTLIPPDGQNDDHEQQQQQQKEIEVQVKLEDYPSSSLPLQNVDENGALVEVEDMVNLSFLHEAAILYNLKARHIRGVPYTRTGDIIIAVNPYQWIDGLYSTETQDCYATNLIWQGAAMVSASNKDDGAVDLRSSVEPHVYETSSLAYRGLACDAQNQSILVSGESGAGKTETVKILMSHLATVQHGSSHHRDSGDAYDDTEDDDSTVDLINSSSHNIIIRRVLESNPLLEAFGNAKTARNDNSSRFGKYIQLQFDCESPYTSALRGKLIPSATLAGSRCVTYLLEKSRVVLHESRVERTYHIFYQLLASPEEYWCQLWNTATPLKNDESTNEEDNDQLDAAATVQTAKFTSNKSPEHFKYLGHTNTNEIEGKTDGERWGMTVEALETIGIKDETLHTLMSAMCVVLQLGNLVFEPDPKNGDGSVIVQGADDALSTLADLMQMKDNVPELENVLTYRTVTARSEIYKVPLNTVAAKDSCDAFAKEIYARIFDWLVRMINDATIAELNYNIDGALESKVANGSGGGAKIKYGIIGLLDIFGFESFEVNRFEQLCINYANEKLQQKFTQDIFRSVQAEYEYEGIELGEVQFEDNANVLTLVEGRMGLISVLNEECVRPRGNDASFVAKIAAMNKESELLVQDNFFRDYEFGIYHYAGPVVYDATNFVKKNTDSLPADLAECASKCGNELIRTELQKAKREKVLSPPPPSVKSPRSRRGGGRGSSSINRNPTSGSLVSQTVSTKFKNQLQLLMTNIGETRTRYIRCIKPNMDKAPLTIDHESTVAQLRCAGVVAAVTISRSAFPNRLDHEVVLVRFLCLPHSGTKVVGGDSAEGDTTRERVNALLFAALKDLERLKKDGSMQAAFVVGKTRVYFRAGSLEYLENRRLTALSDRAVALQRVSRGYMTRSTYKELRSCAIVVQTQVRKYYARSIFLTIKSCVVILQCCLRGISARDELLRRREYSKAMMVQRNWRMVVAKVQFENSRDACVKIQAIAKGARQRPIYRQLLAEAIEQAKLENQLKALQKKLEEAENARVEAEKRAAAGPAESTTLETAFAQGEEKKSDPQLTEQQQALIDESGKMLEYLRKEVFKLRSQNSQLHKDFDLFRENNQRLMDSNASAGASFSALNQHAKQLNRTNAKLMADVQSHKQTISKLHIAQMELKDELKMKQSTYIVEVQSRLLYQKTMEKMVDVIAGRCRDSLLVEDILAMNEGCESDFMTGPTAISTSPRRNISPPRGVGKFLSGDFGPAVGSGVPVAPNESSLSGRFFSFLGMGSPKSPTEKVSKQQTKENSNGLEVFIDNFG